MRWLLRTMRVLRERDDERGIALAAVLGIGMVVMVLAATMVSVATSGSVTSASDRDSSNAIAAAYAGLADYQAKINADNTYATTYGLATAPFSVGSTFTNGVGSPANPAFQGWVAVPDSTGASGSSYYRYAVNNTLYAQQGVVRVEVTGKAGKTTRTIVANVKPNGFSNYLYWTNYESGDPAVTGENCTPTIQNLTLTASSGTSKPTCSQIQFAPGDILSGRVHSNDVLLACGGDFKNYVESAVGWTTTGCGSNKVAPTWELGTPSVVSSELPPATISGALTQMYSDNATVAASSTGTGCLYTGPTKIVLNAGGTMTVTSPLTVVTNLQSTAPYGSTPAKCGAISDLHGAGATVSQSLLANDLIYVQGEPTSTSDPNYYKKYYTTTSSTPACFSGSTPTTNGVGYPWTETTTTTTYLFGVIPITQTTTTKESPPVNTSTGVAPSSSTSSSLMNAAYGCDDGDLFIQGTYTQAMSFDADNYVYVTGDLTYATPRKATTVLGLVGQNAVFVWNPIDTSGNVMLNDSSRTIDASILSNAGTFTVQNFARGGPRGYLNVSGSIAQDFRGAVGTSGSPMNGYLKNYGYDTSLATYVPPFFPQPTVTTFKIVSQVEVKPAYDVNGNPTG